MEELEKYCLQDVRLTKDLYDLYSRQGFLLVPDRQSDEMVKVSSVKYQVSRNKRRATV